jgi:hypothetical protein
VTDWWVDLATTRRMRVQASVGSPLISEGLGGYAFALLVGMVVHSRRSRLRRNGEAQGAVVCGFAEGFETT